jgi:hypothetical protein
MLISLSKKFIFVANMKTASTSIEKCLRPYCEICMDRSEWGKHISVGHAELRFARVFEWIPRFEFFAFGAIREPVDWLVSLYQSHRGSQFRGTPLDTSDMSFEQFLDLWVAANPDQTIPQVTTLLDTRHELAVDFIIRHEKLVEDFAAVCALLDIPRFDLPHENPSVALPMAGVGPQHYADRIRAEYACDFQIWSSLSGRRLTREERLSADVDWRTPRALRAAATEHKWSTPVEAAITRPRSLTRDDVIWAFRYLLGRDPEGEDVIDEHRALGTQAALRIQIMASEEFKTVCPPQR